MSVLEFDFALGTSGQGQIGLASSLLHNLIFWLENPFASGGGINPDTFKGFANVTKATLSAIQSEEIV